MVFTIMAMTAIVAVCSLGADYGRVQLAKSELQRAADASARAAASAIPSGISAVQSIAVTYAAYNTADGSAIAVNANSDVEFGTWDASTKTFTVLTGSARSNANAIRITARRTTAAGNAVPLMFGQLIGRPSCDVRASAIALFTAGQSNGFVGLNLFDFGNNATVNSYNSNAGTPGGSNLSSSGALGGNSDIKFGNGANIHGNILKGPSASLSYGNNFYISGSQLTQSGNLSFAATENPTVSSSGSVTLGNNQTISLSSGTYHYTNVTFGNGGTVSATGPVTIYISGDLVVGNNFRINAHQDKPANMRIRFHGAGKKFDAGNGLIATADFYGPGYEINTGNNAEFRGSAIAKQIKGGNGAKFYYDTALGSSGGTAGTIAVVD